jgi:hypothetical protein
MLSDENDYMMNKFQKLQRDIATADEDKREL